MFQPFNRDFVKLVISHGTHCFTSLLEDGILLQIFPPEKSQNSQIRNYYKQRGSMGLVIDESTTLQRLSSKCIQMSFKQRLSNTVTAYDSDRDKKKFAFPN